MREMAVRTGMLVQVDLLRAALAEIETVEHAIHVANHAEAVRYATRQAKVGMDAENAAAEIRLRAERRAGELLAQSVEHGGDRRSGSRSRGTTLKVLGVSKWSFS